ncbi:hypothetical protein, partial [Bradyrhizobium sp. LA6.12]|uniref:hypothetical protein n=1 Tax=unclassified Bradyrhizobium TaxID=2631580 RepID=UPI003398A353
SAPMVLWLKPWESRSLPGLPRTRNLPLSMFEYKTPPRETEAAFLFVFSSSATVAPSLILKTEHVDAETIRRRAGDGTCRSRGASRRRGSTRCVFHSSTNSRSSPLSTLRALSCTFLIGVFVRRHNEQSQVVISGDS